MHYNIPVEGGEIPLNFSELLEEINELEECDIVNQDTKVPVFETTIKCLKIAGLAMHIVFFIFILIIKELHTRHLVYLINLSIIGLIYIIYGLVTFDTEVICNLRSSFLCEFQGIFAHYCVYLSAFGVLSLAFYRLACVTMSTLNNLLNVSKLILTLALMWMIPFFIVLIPKYVLHVPINYSDAYLTCRMNFTNHLSYFFFFISFACILPSVVIAVIYLLILYKIKKSKSRIRNTGCKIMNAGRLSGTSVLLNDNRRCSFVDMNSSFQLPRAPEIRVEEFAGRGSGIVECNTSLATMTANCQSSSHLIQSSIQCQQQDPSSLTLPQPNLTQSTGLSTSAASKTKLLNSNPVYLTSKNKSWSTSAELKLAFQFIILYISFTIFATSNTIILFQVSALDKNMSNTVLAFLRSLIWVYHFINPIIYLGFHPVFIEKLKSKFWQKLCCVKKGKTEGARGECNPNSSVQNTCQAVNAVTPDRANMSLRTSSKNLAKHH